MFCSSCGAATPVAARFCASCGQPVKTPAPVPLVGEPPTLSAPAYVPTGLEGIRRRHPVVFWGVLGFVIVVVALVLLRGVAVFLLFAAVLLSAYFAPSLVAMRRDHQVGRVIVVNLFFGWTVVGWVVAMAIAVGDRHPTAAV